jgi:hypothetical protein
MTINDGVRQIFILVNVLAFCGWGLALGETRAETNKLTDLESEVDQGGIGKLQATPLTYVAAIVRVDGPEFRSARSILKAADPALKRGLGDVGFGLDQELLRNVIDQPRQNERGGASAGRSCQDRPADGQNQDGQSKNSP